MDQGEESLVEADEEKMSYLSSFAAGNAPAGGVHCMLDVLGALRWQHCCRLGDALSLVRHQVWPMHSESLCSGRFCDIRVFGGAIHNRSCPQDGNMAR